MYSQPIYGGAISIIPSAMFPVQRRMLRIAQVALAVVLSVASVEVVSQEAASVEAAAVAGNKKKRFTTLLAVNLSFPLFSFSVPEQPLLFYKR